MCIDATDEWRVYMVTNEPLHYKVDLGFVIALSSDVSVQTCKVLRKLLLERRPNKLLSVELAAICRNEQNLEWLVVLAHLMTVVCGLLQRFLDTRDFWILEIIGYSKNYFQLLIKCNEASVST